MEVNTNTGEEKSAIYKNSLVNWPPDRPSEMPSEPGPGAMWVRAWDPGFGVAGGAGERRPGGGGPGAVAVPPGGAEAGEDRLDGVAPRGKTNGGVQFGCHSKRRGR